MGLTSQKTLEKVQLLFDKMFDINSLLDRQVYLLDIKWNLPKYQDYVHHKISHQFPLYADKIQEFGSLREDLFYRGIVPSHIEDYNSVSEMTIKYLDELFIVEKLCADCIYTAIENKDLMYEDFIRNFSIEIVAPLIKQASVLSKAIYSYEKHNDISKWNKDFEYWIISYNSKDGDD